jgi:hypothetical protein
VLRRIAIVRSGRPRSRVSPKAARTRRWGLQQRCLQQGSDEQAPHRPSLPKSGSVFTNNHNLYLARSPPTVRSVRHHHRRCCDTRPCHGHDHLSRQRHHHNGARQPSQPGRTAPPPIATDAYGAGCSYMGGTTGKRDPTPSPYAPRSPLEIGNTAPPKPRCPPAGAR